MSLLDDIRKDRAQAKDGPWATQEQIDRIPQMEAALLAADELATDMMICIGNIRDAAKTDPRWDGVADKLNARLTAYRVTIEAA